MGKPLFHHVWMLYRFIWRRDRIRISVWIAAITFITMLTAASLNELYQAEADRMAIAATMENPAMSAMIGNSAALDDYTTGAMTAHQMLLFTAIATAIMNMMAMVRHTRLEEEEGRTEMIRSLPTGRLAQLGAAVSMCISANILLALFVSMGLLVLNIESMDLQGSLLYGIVLGAVGLLFAAVSACFAQLSESSRGASGLAFALLIGCYLIRAAGDVADGRLSWVSPLGWVTKAKVYVNNEWFTVFLLLMGSVVGIVVAFYMNSIRDTGSGLWPSRRGKKHAAKALLSPWGLALRLNRSGLTAWALGILVVGLSYGAVLGDVESFANELELINDFLPDETEIALVDQFIAVIFSIMSLICLVPALNTMLKLKSEERQNRTEHILSRAVSRGRLLAGYAVIAFSTSMVMIAVAAFGLWASGQAVVEGGLPFGIVIESALVYLPAMWLMTAILIALVGTWPKYAGWIWLYFGFTFFTVYLGGMLQLPSWMVKLSPFGHIPSIPIEEMNWISLLGLTVLTALITVFGMRGYGRRDILG